MVSQRRFAGILSRSMLLDAATKQEVGTMGVVGRTGVKSSGKKKTVAARVPDGPFKEMRQSVRDNLDASEKRLQRSREIVSHSKDILERARQAVDSAKEVHSEVAEDRQKREQNRGRRDDGSGRG